MGDGSTSTSTSTHVKLHVTYVWYVYVCDVCCTFDFDFWGENLKNLLAQEVVTRYTRLEPGLTVSEKCNMVLNIWTWLQRVIIHCTPTCTWHVCVQSYIHTCVHEFMSSYIHIHTFNVCMYGGFGYQKWGGRMYMYVLFVHFILCSNLLRVPKWRWWIVIVY